jgi:hypothetical protein
MRVNLASRLLTRAYWNHWKSGDRLILRDSAEETLKATPMDISQKAEIQRLIKGKAKMRIRKKQRRIPKSRR